MRKPIDLILNEDEKWCIGSSKLDLPGHISFKTNFNKNKGHKDDLANSCRDCKSKIDKEYSLTPQYKQYQSDYSKTPQKRAYNNKYEAERLLRDSDFRMRKRLKQTINNLLLGNKSTRTMEMIGCTIEEAWNHFESQFTIGMTKENSGRHGWQIDHIIPRKSFNLDDPKQVKNCCNIKNLQPLWWVVNLWKSNKILTPEEIDRLNKLKHLAWDPVNQKVISMAEWLDIWNNYKL
jgi:hypothetical protein